MVVFGIDPGSSVTGFGIVEQRRGRLHYVDSGFIRTAAGLPLPDRLVAIHEGLVEALRTHTPDAVAIEAIFRHRSSESALKLGHARGVALLAARQCGYVPFEYNPMTVKQSVGAHGRADKKAVANMVRMLLGTTVTGPADVTDALAIAITHCSHARFPQAGGTR
jgi:crossover junction endodeoxyribonuclease RuvC